MATLAASSKTSQAWRARRKQLTEAILSMYTSATPIAQLDAAFTCYHPRIIFQDPLVRCEGRDQYEAQFRTLRALFSHFKPLSVEITGDFDKISIDTTVEWGSRWTTLKLRQVTLCHISDGGLGVITRHEDLWSWSVPRTIPNLPSPVAFPIAVPVISFFYSRWRPFFGNRSSQTLLAHAEKKGDQWVPRAKAAAASQYSLPAADTTIASADGDEDGSYDASRPVYVPSNGTSSVTQRPTSVSR